MKPNVQRLRVIDSHTAGEPTRVVVEGGPDLGRGSLAERRRLFQERHDAWRSAVVNEPRGSDVLVGAWLVEPADPTCVAGVIFFNNVGFLGMCGHGTIGVVKTLEHLGRIGLGEHRLETPVGVVTVRLEASGAVSFDNVPSWRLAKDVRVEVEGHGTVRGEVAWGGNWFFLVHDHGLELKPERLDELSDFAWRVRLALRRAGIAGADHAEIDHIELTAPSPTAGIDSRNFVLCPGRAYDRSPCGTGTSARLACLYADGQLAPGRLWRQESILGGVFEGSVRPADDPPGAVIPTIRGHAHITAEATLILDPNDPFCWGIPAYAAAALREPGAGGAPG